MSRQKTDSSLAVSTCYMGRHLSPLKEIPAIMYLIWFLLGFAGSLYPGLEADIIQGELFTAGYGFIIDYLMEALRNLRVLDYSNAFEPFLNYQIAFQHVTKTVFTRPSLLYEKWITIQYESHKGGLHSIAVLVLIIGMETDLTHLTHKYIFFWIWEKIFWIILL